MLKHVYAVAWPSAMARPCSASPACITTTRWPTGCGTCWTPRAGTTQDRRSRGYIGLIRNFTRYSWLLMYLFGAGALARVSCAATNTRCKSLGDHTLYLPHATSLRMSDLGYQNKAQSQLKLCYNDLDLPGPPVRCRHPALARLPEDRHPPRRPVDPAQHQRAADRNEYYSSIRPKRATGRCERPITALAERGVQYVEVRCLSTPTRRSASRPAASSMLPAVLRRIRQPLLPRQRLLPAQRRQLLHRRQGRPQARPATGPRRPAREPGAMGQRTADYASRPTAALYDSALGGDASARAGRPARQAHPDATPSARLRELVDGGVSFRRLRWT